MISHGVYNPYSGPPTSDQTKAWEELLARKLIVMASVFYLKLTAASAVMIRADYEEMALAGERPDNSIELFSGGYLASLGVYHDLHCLVSRNSQLMNQH